MIEIPTVLILGAGSSVHCGYPLGRELVAQLCRLRGTGALDGLPEGWTRDRVERFLTTLSYSDPASIDAFLERHRDDGALGKYLIALQLKRRESIDTLFPPSDAGWYRYLFDQLLVNGEPQFERNALSIVSFNYDRSLEAYFFTRLQARFDLSEAEASGILAKLPIIHVHGMLGEFPKYRYETAATPEELLTISRKIQIIHEIADRESEFCNEEFRRAHDLLVPSERIYFLGFGFHHDNMRRFQFFSPEHMDGKVVRVTAPGLGTVQRDLLEGYLAPLGFPPDAVKLYGCNDVFNYAAVL